MHQVPEQSVGSRRTRRWGAVAVLALVALLGAACSSSGRASDDTTGDSTATTSAGTEATFGDLASPCGEGDASGATQQGVTDTSITIGYGDDAGYAAVARPQPRAVRRHEGDDRLVQRAGRHQRPRGRGQLLRRQDPRRQQRHDRGLQPRSSCSSARAGRSTPPRRRPASAATWPRCPASSVEPRVRQRHAHGPAGAEPGRLHAGRDRGGVARSSSRSEVKKAAVMYANYAATIDTKDKVLGVVPGRSGSSSSTAPRSTTSPVSPTGSRSSSA